MNGFAHILGFNDDFRKENLLETWKKCHETGAVEGYRKKEELIERLKQLSEGQPTEDEMRIIFYDSEDKRYLANPLTLALLLKEYELAEKLLDAGYIRVDRQENDQILSLRKHTIFDNSWDYQEIFLTQLTAARSDMPERLFKKLCKEHKKYGQSFSFWEDFIENPFFIEQEKSSNDIKKIPDFCGIDRIYEYDSRLLYDFLNEKVGFHKERQLPALELKEMEHFYRKLMRYVLDSERNIVHLLMIQNKCITPMGTGEDHKHFKFWMEQLHQIQTKCQSARWLQLEFFWHLMTLVSKMQLLMQTWNFSEYQEIMKELSSLISLSKPEDYHFEKYLSDAAGKSEDYGVYIKYLNGWNICVKEPMKIRRSNPDYWQMLNMIMGTDMIACNRDGISRIYDKELRAEAFAELMELPITFTKSYRSSKKQNDRVMELFSALMEYESEELVIACMKKDILPERQISNLIETAIDERKLKIVPAMIAYQAIQKEGRSYV